LFESDVMSTQTPLHAAPEVHTVPLSCGTASTPTSVARASNTGFASLDTSWPDASRPGGV
jgi:hypothetical protein